MSSRLYTPGWRVVPISLKGVLRLLSQVSKLGVINAPASARDLPKRLSDLETLVDKEKAR